MYVAFFPAGTMIFSSLLVSNVSALIRGTTDNNMFIVALLVVLPMCKDLLPKETLNIPDSISLNVSEVKAVQPSNAESSIYDVA